MPNTAIRRAFTRRPAARSTAVTSRTSRVYFSVWIVLWKTLSSTADALSFSPISSWMFCSGVTMFWMRLSFRSW